VLGHVGPFSGIWLNLNFNHLNDVDLKKFSSPECLEFVLVFYSIFNYFLQFFKILNSWTVPGRFSNRFASITPHFGEFWRIPPVFLTLSTSVCILRLATYLSTYMHRLVCVPLLSLHCYLLTRNNHVPVATWDLHFISSMLNQLWHRNNASDTCLLVPSCFTLPIYIWCHFNVVNQDNLG
jgi:hypothetical protein